MRYTCQLKLKFGSPGATEIHQMFICYQANTTVVFCFEIYLCTVFALEKELVC